jgi:hypothetical protein
MKKKWNQVINHLKKKKENEDPGLVQFKEEELQRCLVYKALELPEVNFCTYKKGYITQECYSCMTCFEETKKRAVLCLGCAIKCHGSEDHEITSIGFKRHFRCDCGNNNFLMECKLKKKDEIEYDNPLNVYNHNMENKFCFCNKGDDANSTMIQCFFCEDWFHKEHLNIFGINLENVKEEDLPDSPLICKNCVIKLKDVLKGYDLKKIIYGLMPKIQTESSKLNEIIDNNKEKEPLSLLGKKRKPSNDLEEIKEDDKDSKIIDNQNTSNTQEVKEKEKNICNKKLNLYLENEEFLSQIIQNKQSLFIDCEIFFKLLCHCDEC